MKGIKAVTLRDEVFNGIALFFCDPVLRLRVGERLRRFKVCLISGICIRAKVSVRPDHAISKDKKHLVLFQHFCRNLGVVDRVVDRDLEFAEDLVETHSNVVRIVKTVAYQSEPHAVSPRVAIVQFQFPKDQGDLRLQ